MASGKERAKRDYLNGMKYKDLAEKYGVTLNTIKSWKQRYNWNRKGVHTKENVCTQKRGPGAPKGSQNAKGNRGGRPAPGNKNAEKHGFFSRIFPNDPETLELVKQIAETKSPLDILWENIVIQYTAIARAQKIMWVRDQEDLTKVLKRQKDGDTFSEREWELQHAWDKQANFLQAQARAMNTLHQMIAKYEDLLLKDLGTEEQKLRMAKLKAEIDRLNGDDGNEDNIASLAKVLEDSAKLVKADGN